MLIDIVNLTNHARTDLFAGCFYTVLSFDNVKLKLLNTIIDSLLTCFECDVIFPAVSIILMIHILLILVT